jgi:hypothetical protein
MRYRSSPASIPSWETLTDSRAVKPATDEQLLADARAALASAAERSAQLLRSLPDLCARLPRSDWTVADAAAHLAIALRAFADSAHGNAQQWGDLTPDLTRATERVAALNRLTLAAEPRRDPAAAGSAVVEGTHAFLAATAGLDGAQTVSTPWYGPGDTLTVAQATCLLLGEQVVHGYDIAEAVRRPWPISRADARLVFVAVQALMPRTISPERVGPFRATFRIHLGGSAGFVVQIRDARARIVSQPATTTACPVPIDCPVPIACPVPIDCHVTADPVALMLVGYGRISQWRAIGHGKLITWGRKPWLAFRFVGLFSNP